MKVVPPKRVSHSYVQSLTAPPEAVFPLLCPVCEAEWIPGWDTLFVASNSGVAEEDCVFVTPAEPENVFWYFTRYEPDELVEIVRFAPGLAATRLSIRLSKAPHGTNARVSYTHTSLGGARGDAFVDGFTEAKFTAEMRLWEKRINHYLATGTCLAA